MRIHASLIALLVILIVSLPYVYAARAPGPDYVFGGFLLNPRDGNSYLAKMYQGWRGDWRFTLPYTAEPGEGAYLFLFYLLLGHLARLFNSSLLITFHIARLLGTLVLLWALLRFLEINHFDSNWLNLVFGLAAMGSGMGWLVFLFNVVSSDFWVVEAYPFLSAFTTPHFALGLGLLLLSLTIPQLGSNSATGWGRISRGVGMGIVALLLALLSPFGVILAIVVLGGLLVWEQGTIFLGSTWMPSRFQHNQGDQDDNMARAKRIRSITSRLFWVGLGGAPVLLYDFWIVRSHPSLSIWDSQNLTSSPPLWDLVLSLSPAIILAFAGVWFILQRKRESGRSILIWAGLGILLVYMPWGLQRRFMMGIFVPIAGLAGIALDELSTSFRKRAESWGKILLALSLPTNLLLLLVINHGVQTVDPLLYLHQSEAQALAWIEANTPPLALILSSPETGMFIPAHTGRRVIYGHPFETVNADAEERIVIEFFENYSVENTLSARFLSQRGVDYIFYGPREHELGGPPELDGIRPVFSGSGVVVYQVILEPESGK